MSGTTTNLKEQRIIATNLVTAIDDAAGQLGKLDGELFDKEHVAVLAQWLQWSREHALQLEKKAIHLFGAYQFTAKDARYR